ncbi:hypothetical protein WJX74_011122 [Apatococcus lobatus]|uniref:Uncharacterized protein n=1 Tax=Apatococcus lobatus TaxID=904363 RepID=A0AAW1RWP5_9CHLO
MRAASALPDGEPGQPKGSRSLKAGFKSFFAGNKAGKKGSKPCAGELPKENQPYVSWGQSLDPRAASRSLSPLRPLGHSNSPGLQAEGHAFPRNLDRVSLPELQSALGLRIPAAPAMLSLPASPTAQPAVNPPSTAMSIQASAEWPDNRGGALPGSMMMDSSGMAKLMKGMLEVPIASSLPAVLEGSPPTATVPGPSASAVPLGYPRARSVPALNPSSAAASASASAAEAGGLHFSMPVTPAAVFINGVTGSSVNIGPSQSSRASPRSKSLPMTGRVRFSQPEPVRRQDAHLKSDSLPSISILKQLDSTMSSQKHHTSPAAFAASMPGHADADGAAELAPQHYGNAIGRRSKSLASSPERSELLKMRTSASQPLLRNAIRSSSHEAHKPGPLLKHLSTAEAPDATACQGLTQETVIKSAATLPAGHLKPLPGSAVAATEPCREAVDPQLSMRASRQSTGSAATYTSAEFESFTRDVAARIIQHYWRKNHAASASGAHARDAHGQLAGSSQGRISESTPDSAVSFENQSMAGVNTAVQQESGCGSPGASSVHQSVQHQPGAQADAQGLHQAVLQTSSGEDGLHIGQHVIGDVGDAETTGSADTCTSAVPASLPVKTSEMLRDLDARGSAAPVHSTHATSKCQDDCVTDAPLHDLPHSNLPDRMPGGSQERPPFVPATLLGSKLPEQAAAKDHSQQHASHLQDTTITSTAIGSREPGEDADLPTQLSPFQLEAGTTAAISPDQQADGQPARGDSASFNRASNPDSMVSYTSDAEQSITSSIVAHIMQGQQDGRLLSTASIESSVSGRTALQQEGWRAPKHHRRAPKDKVPLTSPRLIRKQSLQHRSVPTELAASVELPDHTLHPKKRQHRREARPLPPPSLQNEGWHRREDIAVAEPAVASGHPASDGSLHLGSAGAKPDKSGPNLAASSSPQPSAALPQSLSPIPAVMASFSAGQTLALPATSAVPLEVPGDTAKVLPTAIPSAAAAPVSTGQNDKMKDIMAFLDVVEAQIDAQPTLAVGTHQGQVAREALAEITRSQLPPQLQPRLPAATAARIQSWVQDAAQNDAGSESGSQKSGRSLASHGGSSTHLASSVFQGVRAKLSQLKLDVSEKGQLVQKLQGNLKASEAMIQAQAAAAAARQQEVLEQQRKEYEGTIARHLQFVDRLLKDKDDLSTRCAALASDVKSGEQQLATQAAMLREGWALELKRHKDAWAMGEKSRKEAWQAAKMREIKEMTIKGLEPDIEQMRRQHKDDLRHATQQAQEMAKLQVEEKDQEWEKRARQTRQQALLDLDDAVRKERVAGQGRIQEVIERYEAQLQMQRMRLASDKDCAQEQVQSALAEEHKQHRAALDLREQDKAKSEEKLRQQFAEEREQLQRTCDRRLAQLREEYDSNQAGFRAAVAERAKRELATREKAMRERLITERDRELQFVMERLEGEAAEKEAASKAGTQESSRKAAAEHSAALQAAAKAEARVTKRFEQAAHEAAESAKQLQKLERRFEELRTERAAAEEESEDLANQLAVTKKEAAQLQKGMQQAQQNQAQATAALVASLQSKVDAATAQAESIRAKGAVEMLQVEERAQHLFLKDAHVNTPIWAQAGARDFHYAKPGPNYGWLTYVFGSSSA